MSNPALIEVVDDDPDIRRMLQLVLEARGFKVRTHDGAHAYLAAEPVTERRVMLLDVRMPKMTGVELQAQMVQAGNRVPVIFMSGESLPHETLAAQQSNAVTFLWKPFRTEVLLNAVTHGLTLYDQL
ncbi:response regulator [Limnohabitans sp. Rim8]|uniref:response regulator transcription factor n=1 Tax=Limnohabitans sp. Rim8 TaxID=1100718 RepID=UPI0025D956C2|nr:response regulator [Limnohabitans sp. Rim8]